MQQHAPGHQHDRHQRGSAAGHQVSPHSLVSVALAHSPVSVALAHSPVSVALAHCPVSVALAHCPVSVSPPYHLTLLSCRLGLDPKVMTKVSCNIHDVASQHVSPVVYLESCCD